MVFTSILICATDTPNIAGSIRRNTLDTPAWPRATRGRGSSLSCMRNGI